MKASIQKHRLTKKNSEDDKAQVQEEVEETMEIAAELNAID